MNLKGMLNQLNLLAQCRRYGLPLWQCPQFLFLIMGIIIIVSTLIAYAIGSRYIEDPQVVALIVLFVAAILFIIAVIITRSFERLAEANRLKSEFISIVSHQLRSPLSNLNWAIELLMSGRLGKIEEKQTEYFKILKENSARMGELVSDLLIVSRIETAKLPLKKQEFSLEELINNLIKEFEPFARASNVEIKFQSEKNLPKVFSDPSQIRLVIENLLDNAIRYIKDKGQVEIKLEKRDKNFYFEIRDNGVGIPKEDQKYIFQKFFRSENVMRYQTQGSGLGLYISKAIVERSGGKIGFKSEEGKGSTFWFTLPLRYE
jgi:signal transduction histidine kinase